MRVYLFLFVALFGCLCAQSRRVDKLTDEELEFLKNLKLSQIPRHIKLRLEKSKRTGDNSHWCCKNDADRVVTYTQISKIVSTVIKVADKVQTGQHSCGFLNSAQCGTYDVKYHQEVVTHKAYDTVPNKNVCPDNQLTCCRGYVPVSEYCLEEKSFGLTLHLHIDGANGIWLGLGTISACKEVI